MKAISLCVVLFSMAPLAATAQCEGQLVAEMRSTSPLKAAETDSSFVVSVFDSGCYLAHRPSFDLKAGTRQGRLEAQQLQQFVSELRSSKIEAIDSAHLREQLVAEAESLAKTNSPLTLWRVADGDIVEFRIASASKSNSDLHLQWNTLDNDLLNHPSQRDLLSIKAAQSLFEELDLSLFEEESVR